MKLWTLLFLLCVSALALAEGFHRHFHIHQTSLNSFGVTCDNGKPTVGNTADGFEVTCK